MRRSSDGFGAYFAVGLKAWMVVTAALVGPSGAFLPAGLLGGAVAGGLRRLLKGGAGSCR